MDDKQSACPILSESMRNYVTKFKKYTKSVCIQQVYKYIDLFKLVEGTVPRHQIILLDKCIELAEDGKA
jgi:hypothetical protein